MRHTKCRPIGFGSFSALQRAENSSIGSSVGATTPATNVSVLFSEPKIPQSTDFPVVSTMSTGVSVLFSEPKIPQFNVDGARVRSRRERFSALQRAENSSICDKNNRAAATRARFSALQRAENSSILSGDYNNDPVRPFQCSSASRKFLNCTACCTAASAVWSFSALQRAENSSIRQHADVALSRNDAFQCSSASRKFLNSADTTVTTTFCLFQCSSASRKFLNTGVSFLSSLKAKFQCSSASRKFLN